MFTIIGFVVVLGCVIGGFLFEGGNLSVIWQPAELIIIGGAAAGSFIISSPKSVIFGTLGGMKSVLGGDAVSKASAMDLLKLLYDLLSVARKEGVVALESHVNAPEKSALFTRHPLTLKNHHVVEFLCDNVKIFLTGGMEPHRFEALMELDLDTKHAAELVPSQAVTKVADALPGLGIVAAVLGVVLTMGMINEPPEILGHHIGAALVGTFLGVLACYGFIGPIATQMEHRVREGAILLNMVKAGMAAFCDNWPPIMAVEAARRAAPDGVRPTFKELETALRSAGK